ncbi:MAG: aspartate aminotransferase family protein [Bacteroidetes bacterium]|nr:aspartate aminotransferase family protein [Bacteroidota bacterium]
MNSSNRIDLLKKAVDSLERWLFSYPVSDSGIAKQHTAGTLSPDNSSTNKNASEGSVSYNDRGNTTSPRSEEGESGTICTRDAENVLSMLTDRLKGNYPFHSNVYAGQMLKPPHDIAWAAYALTMLINPNNHALDGGPPTSEMEKEVIPAFARMFGFKHTVLGHLTSSGTIANLEALWIARNEHPDKGIAFSKQSHYTHERMCNVLGMKSFQIPLLEDGKWDFHYLESVSDQIGTLVVTMGTTGAGRVEPLHEIINFAKNNGKRVHLDAAYGGYFKLIEQSGLIHPEAWACTAEADSIVIDPHKHGLQPYGCGCVLFKDPSVGRYYKHDSPYTYFSSEELHLGEISLECSRAGAAAAALWATLQMFPLAENGKMAEIMLDCRKAALHFSEAVNQSLYFKMLYRPELDIVVYSVQPSDPRFTASALSRMNTKVFQRGMDKGSDGVFVSLFTVPSSDVSTIFPEIIADTPTITVLRSVLMKPDQQAYVPELVRRLEAAARG